MRLVLIALILSVTACSAHLEITIGSGGYHHGKAPETLCEPYTPPFREKSPTGVELDDLPIEDPELIALILATEIRDLRDYINRRDQRSDKALEEYRKGCPQTGKDR